MRYTIVLAAAGVLACAACSHGSRSTTTTSKVVTQSSASAAPTAATQTEPTSAPQSTGSMATPPASQSASAANGAAASDGATVYQTNCSSCHQASGQGLPGTFPPLAGNPVVTGDPATVIHIVKNGLTGQLTVKGVGYNGEMPAWGQTLSTNDIAAVITYVRSAWGNSAGAVTPAQVAASH